MRYTHDGNLAFDEARARLEEELQAINLADWDTSPIRQREQEAQRELNRLSTEREVYSTKQQEQKRVRTKKISLAITLACLLFGIFGGLMVRQARIYEQNFANTSLKNTINEVREQTQDAQNILLANSDTAHIESEALRLFSLRKPSQMQRVVVSLPESDQISFYGLSERAADGDKIKNYHVLEEYMESLIKDNQGLNAQEEGVAKVYN